MAKNDTKCISKKLIKEQISIMDVLSALNIPQKKRNNRISILCPSHEDRHFGSCYVYPKKNAYHCFACGEHGDVISLVQNYLKLDFQETLKWFADNFNGHFEYDDIEKVNKATRTKSIIDECILSESELRLLGFNTDPVYENKQFLGESNCWKYDLGFDERFFLINDKYWVVQTISVKEPWKKLIFEDFPLYKRIVNDAIVKKCKEILHCWKLFQQKKYQKNNKTSQMLVALYKITEKEKNSKELAFEKVKTSVRDAILYYLSLWVIDNDNPHFHKSNVARPDIKSSVELYNLFINYELI